MPAACLFIFIRISTQYSICTLLYIHPLSAARCPLYSLLSPSRHSVPSAALCPLSGPLSPTRGPPSPLRPSVASRALCPLYGLLYSLQPTAPSTALYPSMALYPSTLSTPSMALCTLYGPLSPLWPSVPSPRNRNVFLTVSRIGDVVSLFRGTRFAKTGNFA
jgi:hypothetical protein